MYLMILNGKLQAPKTGFKQNISEGREKEKGLSYIVMQKGSVWNKAFLLSPTYLFTLERHYL